MEILESLVGNINPRAKTNYLNHYIVISFPDIQPPILDMYYQVQYLKRELASIGYKGITTGHNNGLYINT